MKHTFKPWRLLPLVLFVVCMAFTMTSCGDDEPSEIVIDYYLKVEEAFLVDGSSSGVERFYNPKDRMMAAIRSVYPTPNSQGADADVFAACEKEYHDYIVMYAGMGNKEHLTCIFDLVRIVKSGSRILESFTLRKYVYDINSKPTPIDD